MIDYSNIQFGKPFGLIQFHNYCMIVKTKISFPEAYQKEPNFFLSCNNNVEVRLKQVVTVVAFDIVEIKYIFKVYAHEQVGILNFRCFRFKLERQKWFLS